MLLNRSSRGFQKSQNQPPQRRRSRRKALKTLQKAVPIHPKAAGRRKQDLQNGTVAKMGSKLEREQPRGPRGAEAHLRTLHQPPHPLPLVPIPVLFLK